MAAVFRAMSPSGGMSLWGWKFNPDTMGLECSTASKERMVAALKDCKRCAAAEYPETIWGYDRAVAREKLLWEWIEARWPEAVAEIRAEVNGAAEAISRRLYPHAWK